MLSDVDQNDLLRFLKTSKIIFDELAIKFAGRVLISFWNSYLELPKHLPPLKQHSQETHFKKTLITCATSCRIMLMSRCVIKLTILTLYTFNPQINLYTRPFDQSSLCAQLGPITFESNHYHYHYIAISSLPLPLHTFWICNHYHYHYFGNVIITITHYFWLLIPKLVLQQQIYIKTVNCNCQNRDCQ